VRRRYRLRSKDRFQQVRRQGRSYKHPLLILVALPNDLPYSRFGFTASRRVGNAVQRNRARRLMREAIRLRLPDIRPGWDVVCIARKPLPQATFRDVQAACDQLLARARLLQSQPNDAISSQSP
jgi:ribonuclease P protein component